MSNFIKFIVVIAALLKLASADSLCAVNEQDKKDCGYIGIDENGCLSKGCCWQGSSTNGVPWCFYKSSFNSASCYGYNTELSSSPPFSDSELSTMRGFFLANINIEGQGGIIASSQKDHEPDYYFHWMRDGALTMRSLIETTANFTSIENIVKSYVQWVLRVQNQHDANNIDVRIEPKFYVPKGEPYTGGWCRPQNDGPGLRATALMLAAEKLIELGEEAYVKQYLWTNNVNDQYHGGAIRYDLDLIPSVYTSNTCDIWEEMESSDLFWNRITTKKALLVASNFAASMGDSTSANNYLKTASAVNSTLYSGHYIYDIIQENNKRVRDGAVIVGLNTGYDSSDGLFNPFSVEVANTIASYNAMFCTDYPINTIDTNKGLKGILYGRYHGDAYFGGNPWVLTTAALASIYYRAALYLLTTSNVSINSNILSVWSSAMNIPTGSSSLLDIYNTKGLSGLAKAFAAQGDGILLRLRSHVTARNFHLDEQIDKNNGDQVSALDLTWSYAEVFNAMYHRNNYLNRASL